MKAILLATALVLLPSCVTPVTDRVSAVVDLYCSKSEVERTAIRELVAAKLADSGNRIEVYCRGDDG